MRTVVIRSTVIDLILYKQVCTTHIAGCCIVARYIRNNLTGQLRYVPTETFCGYDLVTSAYIEVPVDSWQRIVDHVKKLYSECSDEAVIGLIGKKPIDWRTIYV